MELSNTTYLTRVVDGALQKKIKTHTGEKRTLILLLWLILGLFLTFPAIGPLLQLIDPRAGVLDIGILSLLFFGLLTGILAMFCCFWLQELLWRPFKFFRQNFQSHFNQLTSWQQCILYFSAFFLSLYAVLWMLAMVL